MINYLKMEIIRLRLYDLAAIRYESNLVPYLANVQKMPKFYKTIVIFNIGLMFHQKNIALQRQLFTRLFTITRSLILNTSIY